MWWNGRVYFESDRDGTMNLWSMTEDGRDLTQYTRSVGWDIRSPSLGDGKVVYQQGADLRLFDITSGQDREVPVTLPSDFDQMRERWVEKPLDYLSAWHLSPGGDRLLLTARGKVFVAPAKPGRFIEATRAQGVRYRSARFLPDAKSLAVLSDQSGELEWWKVSALGLGEPEQLTRESKVLRFDGVPSPDGKWLVHWNQDQERWLTDVTTRQSKRVTFSPQWGFDTPAWSLDGKWLAFGLPAANTFVQLMLYNVADGKATPITTDRYNSEAAAWSADGKWIYCLSDRNLESLVGAPWGARQPEPFFDKQDKMYAIALAPGARFPFEPADELQPVDTATGTGERGRPASGATATPAVTVVHDGIQQRLVEVPLPAGNCDNLTANDQRLFWIERETALPRRANLMTLHITSDAHKPKALADDVRGYELSGDGKKLGVRKGDAFYVIASSAAPPAKLADARVDLTGWTFSVDPREDWRQVFVDSWRLERDYFYDPGMHGEDWKGMLDKYLPVVSRVRSRAELSDLQGGARLPVRPGSPQRALAAGPAGRERARRRRHHGGQWNARAEPAGHRRVVAGAGRQAGTPRRAVGRGHRPARRDREAYHRGARRRSPLRRVGVHPPASRGQHGRWRRRLRAPPRDGVGQPHRVAPRVLPGLQPAGPGD